MSSIGGDEYSWNVMHEHTVDEGCRDVRYRGTDSALSINSLTDDESGSSCEYTTTNDTSSGKSGDINNSNTSK